MTMSDATFDPWQQVYSLSMHSGLIGAQDHRDTAENLAKWLAQQLANFYAEQAAQMGGGWSTVWGPVVFQADVDAGPQIASNVMYAAANSDRSMVVVAIAGTNFKSILYDVEKEDNAVGSTVAWAPTRSGLHPYVSSGTALGVSNLLAMNDGATGRTLAEFLGASASTSARLIFTGHSLGGALAPTLALTLFNSDNGALKQSDWQSVRFYSTAGPTPGNKDFADYVRQEFPPDGPHAKPYQCWNQVVWNSLDVVPQGWDVELLERSIELYPHVEDWPPTDLDNDIKGKINKSKLGANAGKLKGACAGPYTRLANQRLEGTLNSDDDKRPIPVRDKDTYYAQVAYQHTKAYDALIFEVPEVVASNR